MLNDDPPEIMKNFEKTGVQQHPKESNIEFRVEDFRVLNIPGGIEHPV